MIRELITITESSGEVEHTFFETVRDAQTDQEILENLFGELDLDEPTSASDGYLTKDWHSQVFVDKRQPLTEKEEAVLIKFNII